MWLYISISSYTKKHKLFLSNIPPRGIFLDLRLDDSGSSHPLTTLPGRTHYVRTRSYVVIPSQDQETSWRGRRIQFFRADWNLVLGFCCSSPMVSDHPMVSDQILLALSPALLQINFCIRLRRTSLLSTNVVWRLFRDVPQHGLLPFLKTFIVNKKQ
jgi:hypothetical protein